MEHMEYLRDNLETRSNKTRCAYYIIPEGYVPKLWKENMAVKKKYRRNTVKSGRANASYKSRYKASISKI